MQEVRAKFVGTRLEVCIKEVVPFQRKVVLDQQIAVSNKILKTLAVRAHPPPPSLAHSSH